MFNQGKRGGASKPGNLNTWRSSGNIRNKIDTSPIRHAEEGISSRFSSLFQSIKKGIDNQNTSKYSKQLNQLLNQVC
jgi:hypothetical protein